MYTSHDETHCHNEMLMYAFSRARMVNIGFAKKFAFSFNS